MLVEPIAVQGSVIGRSDAAGPGGKGHGEEGDPMFTLNTTDRHAVAYPINTPLVAYANPVFGLDNELNAREELMGTLQTGADSGTRMQAVLITEDPTVVSPTLTAYNMDSRSPQSEESQRIVGSVFNATGTVRRLTPTECERLQGFPDGWTSQRIDEKKGLIEQADSSRYKQMGNAVAVPCVEWIMAGLVEQDNGR